jgi:RES domain-containing protein
VYTAGSLALAVFPIANTSVKYLRTQGYVAIPVRFNETLVRRLDLKDLPDGWAQAPRSQAAQALGTRWATEASSAVLAVPSSIILIEPNFLLNPRHPDFCKISICKAETFSFDKRLLRYLRASTFFPNAGPRKHRPCRLICAAQTGQQKCLTL